MKKCLDCSKPKSKKGLYCKVCGYKHRKRPSGLKYKKHKENPTSFKKGQKPWNTDTKGFKKPNSGSFKKGEHRSKKTEFKIGDTSKEKNCRWKGGITPLNKVIRHCFKYRQWISDIFTRDDYTCQKCGQRGCYLEAHHIKEFHIIMEENKIKSIEQALDCEELWNINNGKTLCKKCHRG